MKSLTAGSLLFSVAVLLSHPLTGGEDAGKLVLNDAMPALVKITVDSRARYEFGDEEGLDDSNAATLRNRIGLLSREVRGFQTFVEYEGTLALDRDSYRAASVHGPATRTVIADPESQEVNQAWIAYTTPDEVWGIKAGRQTVELDNQRHIGSVSWRQNQQSLDAAVVNWHPTDTIDLSYGHVWQVNRLFGSEVFFPPQTDFQGASHLFHATFEDLPAGTLTTYAYLLDLHNEGGDTSSNHSFGAILTGPLHDSGITYYGELACQTDAYENPNDYQALYAHGTLSREILPDLVGTLGTEWLGSDHGIGYQFPLGTNHKFNGYADRFLTTPAGGLSDLYASVGTTVGRDVKLATTYHYFYDDGFDTGLGQEIDLVASKDLGRGFTVLAKAARFWGQSGQPDTTRASLEVGYRY